MNLSLGVPEESVEALFPAPPPLYRRLFDALERAGVEWSSWKSRQRLPGVFAGRVDLDLLIARPDRQEAARVLTECGFKHVPDISSRDDPAMMSFLGFDETVSGLLHVHAHFRLIMGPPLFKNDRLPCEAAFLARSRCLPGSRLRVLSAEDAALLLFVRAQLELGRFDPVAFKHHKKLMEKFRNDFSELKPELDAGAVRRVAAEVFDMALAERIAQAIAAPDPVAASSQLRRKVARALAQYRSYGGLEATIRSVARTAIFLFGAVNRRRLRLPRAWGRRAPGGGLVIAFVGVDGSGKSTATTTVCNWLGAETDALKIYFGTGDGASSFALAPFKAMAGYFARFVKTKPKGASHGQVSDSPPGPLYSLLFALWAIVVALDKQHKLTLAQRAIRRGFIVVTDRYPQSEIESFNDGPLLYRLPQAPGWLRRLEDSVYMCASRAPPDLVIKLHVGAETLARREPDMLPALIDERVASLERLRFQGARTVDIDARAPLDEVTSAVKRAVWNVL